MSNSKQPKVRPRLDFKKDKGRTKQEFRDECNINNILAKFQRTGRIEHMNKHQPTYGDATGGDFAEAMRIVSHGLTLWEDLPSSLKEKFKTVEGFLDYVSDPDNQGELPHVLEGRPPAEPEPKAADEPAGESKESEASETPTTES